MTVLVEAKNLKVTDALRNHVTKQASKLQKISKAIVSVRVFLETVAKKNNDPHANKVTFKVSIPGKDVIVIKEAVDMYEAIIQAAHGALRQVRKTAERRITKARHAHGVVKAAFLPIADPDVSV
jgi:ribosomal subunit interface protein